MKVSLNWLNEYIEEKLDEQQLVTNFNLKSQEVSGLSKLVDVEGLVIGKVISLEKHPEADKLSVCLVDVKTEILQIICGAPNVDKDQLVIVARINTLLPGNFKIKKAKIRGIESFGMICSLDELGISEFESTEKGIYVLGKDAIVGENPLEYLCLDDLVLELDLTANRQDLLSMRGVVYDVCAMLNLKPNFKEPRLIREAIENPVSIFTKTKNSTAYYGQVLENVEIKESPYWIKSRLIASGLRPINNVVDITNYVMLEYGQPLHAFDYDLIKSDRIIVREANVGETLITLDGETRILLPDDLVITDGEKPIALAGVMGGLETEINSGTKRILLESAVFNPTMVRKTANRLNLKSESSTRFEKGVDSSKTLEAMERACELLIRLAGAVVVGKPSFYNTESFEDKTVVLSLSKLKSVTGYDYLTEDVENIFDRLRLKYKTKNEDFYVRVPKRLRHETYQDLIEEIVRLHGFDKIPSTIPKTPTLGGLNNKQKFRRMIRSFLVDRGLIECRNYNLLSYEQATKYDKTLIEPVKILNPLNKEREYLRHSTIPSLTNVLKYNKARKIDDVLVFELGFGYYQNEEKELLGILINGSLDTIEWQVQGSKIDFYVIKGLLESLFKRLGITDYQILSPHEKIVNLHPGISADIKLKGNIIGFIGRFHPVEEKHIGVEDVFVAELDLDELFKCFNQEIVFEPIGKYPSIKRDLALLIKDEISAQEVVEAIKKAAKKSLRGIEIFDFYKDEKMVDYKSLAFTLEFSKSDRTLEAVEVDLMIDQILVSLKKDLEVELRK